MSAFVGAGGGTADEAGVRVAAEDTGLVVFGNYDAIDDWTYALTGTGSAELVGIDDVTLEGSLAVRMNTTGGEVNESIDTGNGSIDVVFSADQGDQIQLVGDATVAVSDFFYGTGRFAIEKGTADATLNDGTTVLAVDTLVIRRQRSDCVRRCGWDRFGRTPTRTASSMATTRIPTV